MADSSWQQTPVFALRPRTSGLAIASVAAVFWTPLIIPIFLGHLAKKEIRESQGNLTGDGLATAGLALGYIALTLFVLLIALATFSALTDPTFFQSTESELFSA